MYSTVFVSRALQGDPLIVNSMVLLWECTCHLANFDHRIRNNRVVLKLYKNRVIVATFDMFSTTGTGRCRHVAFGCGTSGGRDWNAEVQGQGHGRLCRHTQN